MRKSFWGSSLMLLSLLLVHVQVTSFTTTHVALRQRSSQQSRQGPPTPWTPQQQQHHPRVTSMSPSSSAPGSKSTLALSPLDVSIDTVLLGEVIRTIGGIWLAATIAKDGQSSRKQSLSTSGAWAAFFVASFSLACSTRSGITLLWFYLSSSKLTKMGKLRKQQLEEDYQVGGQRGAEQVLACSLVGVIAAIFRRLMVGADSPLQPTLGSWGNRWTLCFVAFFACCAGDTWASELGVLSKSNPRLVTKPWKVVAPGTNGGVSNLGLVASAAGGLAMGCMHGLLVPPFVSLPMADRFREILVLGFIGLLAGLGGSLLDSFLGATIQVTYYDPVKQIILKTQKEGAVKQGWSLLSNEMVNVVSTAATAALAAWWAPVLLGLTGRLGLL